MKIGIATWQNVYNHGAVLQAYASKCIFESKGHIVSYVEFEAEKTGYHRPIKQLKDYFPWVILKRKSFTRNKIKIFNSFTKNHFTCLKREVNNWNLVMIGADEVFSIEGGFNDALFGIGYMCPVFSYAASCGPSTEEDFGAFGYREEIAMGLNKMLAVGVRDSNTFNFVKHFSNATPVMTLDPVLLYGFRQENKKLINERRSNICLYAYSFRWDLKKEIRISREFANNKGMRIDSIGFFHAWCDKNLNVSPLDIFETIRNYKYMLTDTFHGTIMAILTHTPFAVIVRNNSPKLIDLLSSFELSDRIISDTNSIEVIFSRDIDFARIDKILDKKRSESFSFIEEVLQKIEG